jgi:hypothetical protein
VVQTEAHERVANARRALRPLALAAAGLYTVLVSVGYWETVANILIIAGALYAYVIERFEAKAE